MKGGLSHAYHYGRLLDTLIRKSEVLPSNSSADEKLPEPCPFALPSDRCPSHPLCDHAPGLCSPPCLGFAVVPSSQIAIPLLFPNNLDFSG